MVKLKNFPNYSIDKSGIVTNIKTGRVKKVYNGTQIELYNSNGKKIKLSLALLVVNTFIDASIKLVESIGFRDNNHLNICLDNVFVKTTEYTTENYPDTLYKHPKYSHIYADNNGNIFSTKLSEQRGIIPAILYNIAGTENADGYLEFGVSRDRTNYKKHRAIYECISNSCIEEGMTINHKDGDKNNNCYSNLECITRSANSIHMHNILFKGMLNSGEANKSAKLTEIDVLYLRRNKLLGLQQPSIITDKVSKQSIYSAITGRTWKFLPIDLKQIDEKLKCLMG